MNTSPQYFTPPDLGIGFQVPVRNVQSGTKSCHQSRLKLEDKFNGDCGPAPGQKNHAPQPNLQMSGVFPRGIRGLLQWR